ncbi:MAG: siderophore-interacting protein [Caulobacteraceae bacterium]
MADDARELGRQARMGFRFDLGRLHRPPLPSWRLTVVESAQTTPRTRTVSFGGEGLAELDWRPGQDLLLSLPQEDGETARRHYTIRDFNREARRLDIDFVLHGQSPATYWARHVQPGDAIEAHGPRGRTRLANEAKDHLFVGDETAMPAIFAMVERLEAGARADVLIEVEGPAETEALASDGEVSLEWVFRGASKPGPSGLLLDRLAALAPSPQGRHAYILGETSNVRAQRHLLLDAGFERGQITAEGYWRPGRIGGHDHV